MRDQRGVSDARGKDIADVATSASPLTAEQLCHDFGPTADLARLALLALHAALAALPQPQQQRVLDCWQEETSLATGGKGGAAKQRKTTAGKRFARQWGLTFAPEVPADALRWLFCVQTWYALIAKGLAYRLQFGSAANELEEPRTLAHAARFEELLALPRLSGAAAELDCFAWYLHAWQPALATLLAELSQRLASYSRKPIGDFAPGQGDVLKRLYLSLVPAEMRHQLGEFYTPDWLAQLVLQELDYSGQAEERLLDPTCGSGTFLVLAIEQKRQRAAATNGDHAAWLEEVCAQIVGIDLHPLAVHAARANYLLALGSLRETAAERSPIPIYWGDVVVDQPPQNGSIPPLAKRFNFVAGNPPWVGWETLPEEYRRRTRDLWEAHGLFPHGGMDTILGHGKKDLALLLSYVVSERYLADRGRLGFLITQGAFKTAGAGEGFRRFHTERGPCSWGVRRVHDLAQLEPFSHAATQTCLFTWERGLSTEYPVPYVVWQPQPHGSSTIAAEATLSEVEQSTTRVTCLAEPVDATSPASTWLTLPAAAREPLRRLLGSSPYLAHEGVNSGGCNGVYWLELLEQRAGNLWRVRNLTAGARRPVPQVESLLEADLLFPLLRGREVRTWQATTSASILLVQDVATRKGLSAEIMQQRYPHAFDYLNHFATELRSRAAFTRYFTRRVRGSAVETAPFWSMFNVGSYTLSPWKVVWHRMITPLGAVVVGSQQGKPILPQETHAFIATASADEAYYLAGLLNSLPLQVAALSCSQAGSKGFGSPQLIGRLNLPSFEPQQAQHLQIATLAKARQGVEAKSDPAAARHLQQQLDLAAARLFELDAAACDVLATTATLFTSSLAHASLSDASLASTSPAEASQADPMPE